MKLELYKVVVTYDQKETQKVYVAVENFRGIEEVVTQHVKILETKFLGEVLLAEDLK